MHALHDSSRTFTLLSAVFVFEEPTTGWGMAFGTAGTSGTLVLIALGGAGCESCRIFLTFLELLTVSNDCAAATAGLGGSASACIVPPN